jgi:uncharacterized membrane protein
MQNPPGPPQPAASTGVDKRTGAFLSYLAIWVTGIIFLFVGKNDPDVKYHAAQSVVVFGSLTVLQIVISIASNFLGVIAILGFIVWVIEVILWLYCMYKAWTGGGARFEAPIVGSMARPYTEQLMNAVN